MDRMSSIELALQNEKSEMEFYLQEAKRSKNETAKQMFSLIAKDELEHMTRIKALHGKLVSNGKWPEDVPIEVKGTTVRDILKALPAKARKDDHDDDDIRALKHAMEFEKKGSKFYSDLAGACSNKMEKNFFEFISKIENEHYRSLSDTLLYLTDPESWFREKERSGLDGA